MTFNDFDLTGLLAVYTALGVLAKTVWDHSRQRADVGTQLREEMRCEIKRLEVKLDREVGRADALERTVWNMRQAIRRLLTDGLVTGPAVALLEVLAWDNTKGSTCDPRAGSQGC